MSMTTGANTGIGKEITEALLAHDFKVIMGILLFSCSSSTSLPPDIPSLFILLLHQDLILSIQHAGIWVNATAPCPRSSPKQV